MRRRNNRATDDDRPFLGVERDCSPSGSGAAGVRNHPIMNIYMTITKAKYVPPQRCQVHDSSV
jgi:hypothetical protein